MTDRTGLQNCCCCCCSAVSNSCVTPWTAAHQAPRSWDSPGKNTGVGCPFLLQCIKVKSESEVTQLCPTLSDPMDCSPPGSSVHGDSPGQDTGVGCHFLLQLQNYSHIKDRTELGWRTRWHWNGLKMFHKTGVTSCALTERPFSSFCSLKNNCLL